MSTHTDTGYKSSDSSSSIDFNDEATMQDTYQSQGIRTIINHFEDEIALENLHTNENLFAKRRQTLTEMRHKFSE